MVCGLCPSDGSAVCNVARGALVSCLLALLVPEPLAEGTVVQELDKCLVGVLRQLAFEPRFDRMWSLLSPVYAALTRNLLHAGLQSR